MPSFGIGSSQRSPLIAGGRDTKFKPGPGRYNQDSDTKMKAPKFSFGYEQRPELGRKKHQTSPAPGAYQEKTVMGTDGPRLSMSPKYKETKDKRVPGPGQYEFSLKDKKTGPNYGIGTSLRMDPS